MGRNDKTIKTYGRHRNRVIHADIWSSGEENQKNLFSMSSCSSNGSLSLNQSTSSVDNSNESVFAERKPRKVKNRYIEQNM
ncbi:hypothetical protein KUTeg_005521 [Tegillarca granosa]|uniref:Uncharacterized protein n=1 Tax=Tegillarca granosa TaxID=220873 RepID=A0ABQ9FJX0_TEGGR|nr:hypothetical protein KUTeg_005521 [Tegillarca granosa]